MRTKKNQVDVSSKAASVLVSVIEGKSVIVGAGASTGAVGTLVVVAETSVVLTETSIGVETGTLVELTEETYVLFKD